VPLVFDRLVHAGRIPVRRAIELLSTNAARVMRVPGGTLEDGAPADITIIDPGAYQKPFTVQTRARLEPAWELMEYICQENNTNVEHIQGPARVR